MLNVPTINAEKGKEKSQFSVKGFSPWRPERSVHLTVLKTTETMLNLPTATACLLETSETGLATLNKPGDTVTWLYQVSLYCNSQHL